MNKEGGNRDPEILAKLAMLKEENKQEYENYIRAHPELR
jgi:hypothetical protein